MALPDIFKNMQNQSELGGEPLWQPDPSLYGQIPTGVRVGSPLVPSSAPTMPKYNAQVASFYAQNPLSIEPEKPTSQKVDPFQYAQSGSRMR